MIGDEEKVIWEGLPWKIKTGKYRRFNQKFNLFIRTGWDPKIQEVAKKAPSYVVKNVKEGKISTLLDYALMSAGWWVAIKGAAHQMDRGDGGLVSWESDISPVYSIVTGPWRKNPEMNEEREKFRRAMKKKPHIMTQIVKKVARYLGADLVGIAPYDPRWVFSHRAMSPRYHANVEFRVEPLELPKEVKYCIVMAFEEDYEMQKTPAGGPSMGDIGFGYSRMAITAGSLAEFLRGLGFIGIPSGNDTALSIPYAIMAGLGEYSRMGILITKEYGPRVRLAKVFTDAPLVPDRPIRFGVYEFCLKCKKCAEQCPARAIPFGEPTWEGHNISNNPGVYKWYVDGEKCFRYWIASGSPGCGICVRVCPYNKPKSWIHGIFRDYFAPLLGGDLGRKIDDLLGYGKRSDSSEWWGFEYSEIVK